MRFLLIVLAAVVSAVLGFAGGYYYRAANTPVTAEIEDYAYVNILETIGQLHYLAKGDIAAIRSLSDVSLNGHLSRVRAHAAPAPTPEAEAAHTRTLNAVAVLWERYPPFQSSEWQENPTNTTWWPEWSSMHKQNLALVRGAKAKCAASAHLNCKAQAPEFGAHAQGK